MTEKPASRISTAGAGAAFLALLLAAYIGSFVYLSRTGMQRERKSGGGGEYYDFLDNDHPFNSPTRENFLHCFYYPLIEIDTRLISGWRHADYSHFLMRDVP